MGANRFVQWVGLAVWLQVLDLCFSLYCWENSLSSNASSNTIEVCNSGSHQQRRANSARRPMRSSTTSTTTSPNSSQPSTPVLWITSKPPRRSLCGRSSKPSATDSRSSITRLIADAEASDLPREYCSSTMIQFLVRVLQLSPGEAAARVRAAAAVGSRTSMLGASLDPVLPRLAALQRDGVVNAEKVAIVERAMHQLSRHDLDPEAVETAEQLLTDHAAILAPPELKRFAHAVVNAADPDGPQPVDDQLQQDRRYLELKQRRDGMWHLAGRLTTTVGAQLNAILDPLTKPRSTAIEDEDGTVVDIPDQRPHMQRLHDALEEACARLLKAADQPSVGGIPASVIITISLEDLLAKAGVAETADGTQLTSDQLLRIADEAEHLADDH